MAGLDEILGGGLPSNRLYVEGDSASGTTTLAMQFLLKGVTLAKHAGDTRNLRAIGTKALVKSCTRARCVGAEIAVPICCF
ncbi:MAG: hypothetical protein JO022_05400 [Acidobacteriaceae bacterium]|nr:hypothetical protein [Acidobacteriaceae bacterium]